jgi:hypothetical protein
VVSFINFWHRLAEEEERKKLSTSTSSSFQGGRRENSFSRELGELLRLERESDTAILDRWSTGSLLRHIITRCQDSACNSRRNTLVVYRNIPSRAARLVTNSRSIRKDVLAVRKLLQMFPRSTRCNVRYRRRENGFRRRAPVTSSSLFLDAHADTC